MSKSMTPLEFRIGLKYRHDNLVEDRGSIGSSPKEWPEMDFKHNFKNCNIWNAGILKMFN